ncbi:MAG: hypothetical protein P8Y27_08560 [Chromatiaceae bacterium]
MKKTQKALSPRVAGLKRLVVAALAGTRQAEQRLANAHEQGSRRDKVSDQVQEQRV